jgi:hypothetical protein
MLNAPLKTYHLVSVPTAPCKNSSRLASLELAILLSSTVRRRHLSTMSIKTRVMHLMHCSFHYHSPGRNMQRNPTRITKQRDYFGLDHHCCNYISHYRLEVRIAICCCAQNLVGRLVYIVNGSMHIWKCHGNSADDSVSVLLDSTFCPPNNKYAPILNSSGISED